MKPHPKTLIKNPIHFISLGFGTGLAPKAPGTFGTLVGIPAVLLFAPLGVQAYLGIVVMFSLLGIYFCQQTGTALGQSDHGAIVWDEIVGYMIAMIAIPVAWQTLLLAFLLFRFFDIRKPWPIKWFDQKVKGGLGVMLDDVLAGLATLVIMHALLKADKLPGVIA
ncbi:MULTISPECIES: phosphatidylglycerophosphatase A [Gammaproteobacteria]|uniref:phosphatidylglycerophosphatase A family protein n=1 Tax=Gammaproteobacteria TaxID=1236 RepID=UPI000DD07FF5|nr:MULTISPECIES: phosphatidylglycerophosphatase A [Gammaproteobacteria]RTE85557.1 phosphatidylglycerophosphatase A [Aliidiomarina sp. B3213]TCZ89527.1 phosphatidylglycerophosphatase A [Lysobacter sp. N42]